MKIQRESINLRRHMREIINESNRTLDFSNVDFISRAVADEIYNQVDNENSNIKIENLNEDVKKMLDVVGNLEILDISD